MWWMQDDNKLEDTKDFIEMLEAMSNCYEITNSEALRALHKTVIFLLKDKLEKEEEEN